MKYEWLDSYCLSKEKAVKDFKEEWNATRYLVGGKMFALLGHDASGKEIITLKLEPCFGQFLRDKYEDIVPGYYMNKVHWNSLSLDGNVPDDVCKDMIDQSYQLIFKSLTRKLQKELLNLE